jgi:ribosomal protein L32
MHTARQQTSKATRGNRRFQQRLQQQEAEVVCCAATGAQLLAHCAVCPCAAAVLSACCTVDQATHANCVLTAQKQQAGTLMRPTILLAAKECVRCTNMHAVVCKLLLLLRSEDAEQHVRAASTLLACNHCLQGASAATRPLNNLDSAHAPCKQCTTVLML